MIQQDVPLKDLSFYKIGGPARYFLTVADKEDLIAGMRLWQEICLNLEPEARKHFIAGDATNILFDDRGYNGLIIQNKISHIQDIDETTIEFGSGLLFSKAVSYSKQKTLSGFEWAGGLPGSVGGAVRGNAGAFGSETKDNVVAIESVDLSSLELKNYDNHRCEFSYRSSVFKTKATNELITSATFKFKQGDYESISEEIRSHAQYRRDRQPLNFPSAGSTFKNVDCRLVNQSLVEKYRDLIKNDPFPVIPVACLLNDAGLKNKRVGNAQISEKHPNFIINLGNASAEDVRALIATAINQVKQVFGITIELEIIILNY